MPAAGRLLDRYRTRALPASDDADLFLRLPDARELVIESLSTEEAVIGLDGFSVRGQVVSPIMYLIGDFSSPPPEVSTWRQVQISTQAAALAFLEGVVDKPDLAFTPVVVSRDKWNEL